MSDSKVKKDGSLTTVSNLSIGEEGEEASSKDSCEEELSRRSSSILQDKSPHFANFAIECAITDNVKGLAKCFENEADPNHSTIASLINARSTEDGKSALDWASMLGNTAMVSELIARGADINAANQKGYTALHLAAVWDQIDCIRVLMDSGANLELKNTFDEGPREVALRYKKQRCLEFLDWAETKRSLKDFLVTLKEQCATPEKMKVLSKEDKATVQSMIAEATEYVEKLTSDTSVADVKTWKENIEKTVAPIIARLAEQPAESKKGTKKPK